MKKVVLFLSLFACTFIMTSCNDQRHWQASLEAVDSMVDERPDSALTILDSLERHSGDFSKPTEMRWRLLRLKAQNKCDTVFRSDRLQHILSEYYDKHGTPNERMTAYYLLGRAYSDMGEAPEAIRAYQKAVECADTTAQDCDNRQLAIIHIQTGHLFYKQYLPAFALSHFDQGAHWALVATDSSLYLNATEQKITAYYEQQDYAKMDSVTMYLHHEYVKRGEYEKSSKVLGTSLLYAINTGQVVKAKRLMEYVDAHVDRERMASDTSWCIYNAYHGKLNLLEGQLDSAESAFRSLAAFNNILSIKVMASKGLMEIYEAKGKADSVFKYSTEYCLANDSSNVFSHAKVMERMHGLYNYDRMRLDAYESKVKTERVKALFVEILLLAVFVALVLGIIVNSKRKANKRQLISQINEYNNLRREYEFIQADLQAIKTDKDGLDILLRQKEDALEELKRRIGEYDVVARVTNKREAEENLHNQATQGKKASYSDLKNLRNDAYREFPSFHDAIRNAEHPLGLRDENICVMIRQGFLASEIAILLGMSPQALSNAKRKILKNMFGIEGKANVLNQKIFTI